MKQLSLPLSSRFSYYQDWKVTPQNQEATLWIQKWPEWGRNYLILLIGDEKKNKLISMWAEKSHAVILPFQRAFTYHPFECPHPHQPLVLENLDNAWGRTCDEWLFHFYNNNAISRRPVILTAQSHYREWPVTLKDLLSRLNSHPLLTI